MRRFMNILLALAVLVACERRPLEEIDYRTHIDVKVNIEAIANVTCDVYNENIPVPKIDPEVMHVLFFDKDGEMAAESFISEKGSDDNGQMTFSGELAVFPGNYKMLIYNFGTESTIIRNHYSWDDAEAYTNNVSDKTLSSYKTKLDEDERVVYEPDHLVVARSQDEYIPYHTKIHTIETEATSIVESFYLQIKVEGLEYVSSAQAFLRGMVSGNKISQDYRITNPANTLYFPLVKSEDDGVPVICNVFSTFGRIENSHNELLVTFDIKTIDGRIVQKEFDISDLFLSEECIKHHWLLLDETITIDPPEISSSGGGFAPEVEDWENENYDVEL